MDKIIAAALLAGWSAIASAEAVELVSTADGKAVFYGYTESFTVLKDAYSVMVEKRVAGADPVRRYYGILFTDCNRKSGTLYEREYANQQWVISSNVSFENDRVSTIGDSVAAELCNAGASYRKAQQKPVKKVKG